MIDNAFLLLVAAATGREIIKGKNWRNLKVLIALGVLLAGNILFHIEAQVLGAADHGIRFGVAATMMLIMLIGGRIIPSFTRNWLVRENPGRRRGPPGLDRGRRAPGGAAWPLGRGAHLARPARADGAGRLGPCVHRRRHPAWSGGAMGVMTLAVMSRASLGHTGQALAASAALQGVYLLLVVGALARVCAAMHPAWSDALLHVAGLAWAAAFVGFALAYWNVLIRPRVTS